MSEAEKGQCLCGAVKFEAEGKPMWVAHCHCHSCRRNTGCAVTTFVGLKQEQFRYVEGSPKSFTSSPGVSRSFCSDCGTPLAYEGEHCPDEIHIYVSTFDHPEVFAPTVHVFTAEQIPWLHMDDGLKRYKGRGRED